MIIEKTCFECLLTRIEYEARLVLTESNTKNEKTIQDLLSKCRVELQKGIDEKTISTEVSSRLHRLTCETIGNPDPYFAIKEQTNKEASKVFAAIKPNLKTFRDFALAATIGNTLDFGSKEHNVDPNFSNYFFKEFKKGFTHDDCDKIEKLAKRVVYLCDNSGEIVFDSAFAQYLIEHGSHITFVVKGAPIINDATMADISALRIDEKIKSILTSTNGVSEVGSNIEIMPDSLRQALDSATLIISKGMANYESLSVYKDQYILPPIAYLMMVKCNPIAKNIGIKKGSRIAYLEKNQLIQN